jgi:hypothetical protein
VDDSCSFIVLFSFSSSFKKPSKFIPHSCCVTSVDSTSRAANRHTKATQLAELDEVRELFVSNGRDVAPKDLKKKVESIGLQVSYHNCLRAYQQLRKEFFGDDSEQYSFLPSYIKALEERGHIGSLCMTESGTFDKLGIIYREGIKAFHPYSFCGISVDGTFLKNMVGGILLIACFRNGNKEIQIIACGVVSIENEENWSWFFDLLFKNLTTPPAFIISDRDKGLVPALAKVAPGIMHFYCFRHLMENFNRKFKSKALRNIAWKLSRSRCQSDYMSAAEELEKANPAALQWLMDIPVEKWSILHSPLPRFGLHTSNNVESVNSALRATRKLPILDMLIDIERYVGTKWAENLGKHSQWMLFTKKAALRVEEALRHATDAIVTKNSSTTFLVQVKAATGVPLQFAVDFKDNNEICTCRYDKDMGAPCVHVLLCLKMMNKLNDMAYLFHPIWRTETFQEAYKEEAEVEVRPFVLKGNLTAAVCIAPTIVKKKGRPKKKRRESQQATVQLSQKRLMKCGKCGGFGHNKRTCTDRLA